MKKGLFSTVALLVTALALGTAHAQLVMGAPCDHGDLIGKAEAQELVTCANGKSQDANSVPMATVGVDIKKYNSAKMLEASYLFNTIVGTRISKQYSESSVAGVFAVAVSVMAFNPDNTAHVVIDIDGAGWQKHVDATVPINETTEIAPNNSGAVFRLTVMRSKPV